MTLLTGVLAMGRVQAESRMTETVAAGPYTESVNVTTLATTRTLGATVYGGIARVKYPTQTVSEGTAAGQQFASQDIIVSIPVGSAVVPVGGLFRVSASTVDASLVLREYRVKAAPQAGQVTALRYPVEELS